MCTGRDANVESVAVRILSLLKLCVKHNIFIVKDMLVIEHRNMIKMLFVYSQMICAFVSICVISWKKCIVYRITFPEGNT